MDLLEKAWWNKTWNSILVRLGIRRVPGATSGLGDILYGLSITGGETTADMTLYVDQATGSDSNSGLVGFPMKTIQAAINRVPKTVKHNVTINVGPGTYVGNVTLNFDILTPKYITLQGTHWTSVVPATGVASGTFTANDGSHQFTLAAAGWTIDDLKGKFVKITSGAKSGNYYPIANNTATTIDVGCLTTTIGNASFEFAIPAATLTPVSGSYSLGIFGTVLSPSSSTPGIVIQNLTFSGAFRGIRAHADMCDIKVIQCKFFPTASGIGIESYGVLPAVDRCYSGASGMSIGYTAGNGWGSVINSVFDGLSAASTIGINLGEGRLQIGGLNAGNIIQGYTGSNSYGIALTSAHMGSYGLCTIRGCKVGIYVSTGYNTYLSANTATPTVITSATEDGIRVSAMANLKLNTLNNGYFTITGCGRDAIRLESSGNVIDIERTSSITGNAGFGVNMIAGNVSHNNVFIKSTVTMNTNTAGDLTLDGTTSITIAALRADPNKTMVDLLRLNRLSAD